MKGTLAATAVALALTCSGCEGSEIAIFAANSGGSAGSSGASSSPIGGTGGGLAGSAGQAAVAGNSGGAQDGGAEAGVPSCTTTTDCPGPGWLCAKDGCSAAEGVCVPVPVFCPADAIPVCGCDDHVSYWNDCVRQQASESASSIGECGEGALACDSSTDCPSGATCSHLLPPQSSCNQPGPGNCWVTPFNCPTGADVEAQGDGRRWMPCGPPGGPPPCVSTCQAIQAGRPYQPLAQGAQCF